MIATANGQTAKGKPTAQEQVRRFKNKIKRTKLIFMRMFSRATSTSLKFVIFLKDLVALENSVCHGQSTQVFIQFLYIIFLAKD